MTTELGYPAAWDDYGPPPQVDSPGGSFTLRPYQVEAVEAVFTEWAEHDSLLMVKATGLGKTVSFADIVARWPSGQGRILVMAHRDELVEQAVDKIDHHIGERPEVEMGERAAGRHGLLSSSNVVVTSVQTMSRPNRMGRFDPEDFGLLIIDEAHHAPAATYRRVVDYFSQGGLKVLGVTATPHRKDGKELGDVFDAVCFEMDICAGISEGWLVDIEQKYIEVKGLDFSWIKTTAGDLNERQLAIALGGHDGAGKELTPDEMELLQNQEEMLHAIVTPTLAEAAGRPTLVFAVTCAHAERLTEVFNRHDGVIAKCILGTTPKDLRRQTVAEFQSGAVQVLVGVGCFLEGFDAPATACVAVARPTKSRVLYTQAVGRGTRPLPGVVDGVETAEGRREAIEASGKPVLTVLDFVGNSGRHKLMSTADILCSSTATREDVDAAVLMARESGEPASMKHLVDKSEEARREREEQEKEAEEQRRRDAARRARLRAVADYEATNVDPFGNQSNPEIHHAKFRGGATDKQVGYLVALGVRPETAMGYNKAQAGAVITSLKEKAGGDFRVTFGKHKGKALRDVPRGYRDWMSANIDNPALRRALSEMGDGGEY